MILCLWSNLCLLVFTDKNKNARQGAETGLAGILLGGLGRPTKTKTPDRALKPRKVCASVGIVSSDKNKNARQGAETLTQSAPLDP